MGRHKEEVYKIPVGREHLLDQCRYFVHYLNFILCCDSLTNLKKEIKKIEKYQGVNIYSLWKGGKKDNKPPSEIPLLITHYKPKGVK